MGHLDGTKDYTTLDAIDVQNKMIVNIGHGIRIR